MAAVAACTTEQHKPPYLQISSAKVTLPCGCMRMVCASCALILSLTKMRAAANGTKPGLYRCGICGVTVPANPARLYKIEKGSR